MTTRINTRNKRKKKAGKKDAKFESYLLVVTECPFVYFTIALAKQNSEITRLVRKKAKCYQNN